MHEQHLSYPVSLALNHSIQQNHTQIVGHGLLFVYDFVEFESSSVEDKDENSLSISIIKPSTKIRTKMLEIGYNSVQHLE